MVASSQEKGRDDCFNSAGLDFHIDHNIICFCYYFVTEEKLRPCQIHSSVLEEILQQETKCNRKPNFDVLLCAEPAGPEEMVWSLHQTPYSYPVPLPGTLVKSCPWTHFSVSFNLWLTLASLHLKSLPHICLEGEYFMNSCKIWFHLAFFL